MDGQSGQNGRTKKKEGGRPFVAEVARIVTVNRNYGPVITAAGRYVSSETYLTVYYIEYISINSYYVSNMECRVGNQKIILIMYFWN